MSFHTGSNNDANNTQEEAEGTSDESTTPSEGM